MFIELNNVTIHEQKQNVKIAKPKPPFSFAASY